MPRRCSCGHVPSRRGDVERAIGRVTRAGRMGGVDLPNLARLLRRRPELAGIGLTPLLEGATA